MKFIKIIYEVAIVNQYTRKCLVLYSEIVVIQSHSRYNTISKKSGCDWLFPISFPLLFGISPDQI